MKAWKRTREGERIAQVINKAWPLRHDYSLVRNSLRHLIRRAKLMRDPGQTSGGKEDE